MRHTLLLLLATLLLMTVSKRVLQPFVLTAYPDNQFFAKHYFYLWFFAQLPVFITGILVYQIFVKVADKPDRFMGIVLLAFFAFLSVAFLQVSTYASLLPDYVLYGFAFTFLTLALTFHPTRLLVNPFTIWIGKLSYSIYLVHFGIAVLLLNSFEDIIPSGDISYILVFILLTVITLPISWLTYTLVEKPGIRLGKRIIRQLEQSQTDQPQQTGERLLN